ncbi:MAG: pseudouridine synthase [Waddliaceae bacterium]
MRLSKRLAKAGLASRRMSEELIFEGRVKVNGEVVKIPQTLVTEEDEILFDDMPLQTEEAKVYYLLNKPSGYLCSNKRLSKRQRLVIDLFDDEAKRLFTVGRLDKETKGLIIVTNDGDFAQRVIHPSKNIAKEYLVKTDQEVTSQHLKVISDGTLIQNTHIKPHRVVKVRKGTLKITVLEGKKHEVRLLIEEAGLNVLELKRIRIGGLSLGALPEGNVRQLSLSQMESIFE